MNDFLPKDYKEPTTSNYVRLQKGDNRIRVLSKPIMGWEYWVTEDGSRKPVRTREREEIPASMWQEEEKPKFFWAMLVWNYNDSKAQIWEVTQSTIRRTLTGLVNDKDWGNPQDYDINVQREGDGFDTEYTVIPTPPKGFEKKGKVIPEVNLGALYDGDDPFSGTDQLAEEINELLKDSTIEGAKDE